MLAPKLPNNESERLKALQQCNILDTPAEDRFDRLTRLAKTLFSTEIALVSFVDDNRQWFKSAQGLDVNETSREVSFCGHAILDRDIFQVTDASKDARFADNPLVTGHPNIRFYAGAPLSTKDDYLIGTLCIIDSKPRELTNEELSMLRNLADFVEAEINQMNAQQDQELKLSKQLLKSIADAQSVFITEPNRRKAFDNLLSDILKITDSEYGFIGEILNTAENKPYLKTYSVTNIAWNEETQNFYEENAPQGMEFYNLDTLFGTVLKTQKVVISNTPTNDNRAGGLPEGHPDLNAFLGIPVFYGGNIVAMLGIANRPNGYDDSVIEFLDPLLVTIGQLVEAFRTEQKQLENERRLSAIIEGTNIGTWEWNVQTGETIFNDKWAQIIGYTIEELQPISIQTWLDLAHPEDLELSEKLLEQHFAGKSHYYDFKCRMKHKEGHWVWVHDRGRVFSWTNDGKPLMMFGTHADITQETQYEAEITASESRLRGLFELSPVGIALNDYESGAFVEINNALIAPTGYTREEFLALSYWDITPKDYEQLESEQLKLLESTGRYGPYEKEYMRKNGERYPVLLSGMLIKDASGKQMIWSIVEDITERKRIDRMKNEFVSTVSHELRTPLTSISGALGLIAGGAIGQIPDKVSDMIKVALKNSLTLTTIINDLLDMDKLLAGKMHFNMQVQNIVPLIHHSIEVNQTYAVENNVQLNYKSNLDSAMANVDEDRLLQVLANLISNACKFSPDNETVTIKLLGTSNKVRIEVSDNGPGISEEFREQLFEKFSQADGSNTRTKKGTGLGLAISRELMQRMDGIIGCESSEGNGSTFWLEFAIKE